MAQVAPSAQDMFSDATSGVEVVERFENYKKALTVSHARAAQGVDSFRPEVGIVKGERRPAELAERVANLEKSMTSDQLASIQGELDSLKAMTGELNKEWSVTFPNSTGLVPYDLEAPAKLLVPRLTPLRNSL